MVRLLGVAALVACAGLAAHAGSAQAQGQQLKFTFNDGRINLGENKGLPVIDASAGDAPAVLTASYDPATGLFNAGPGGLAFPQKKFENIETDIIPVDVDANFTAIGQISGSFDQTTGVLNTQTLNVSALLSIFPAGDQTLLTQCRIEPVPLPLASTGEIVDDTEPEDPITYEAAPFAPPSSQGAGVATWDTLPDAVFTGGAIDLCEEVDGLAQGEGGIWMAGTAEVGSVSTPAALALTVVPRRRATRVGKAVVFRARVRNTGQTAATNVRVCVRAPKVLRGQRCKRIGALAGGAAAVRPFRLRPTKKAAGKRGRRHVLRFTANAANAGAKSVRSFLRVNKPRKRRR